MTHAAHDLTHAPAMQDAQRDPARLTLTLTTHDDRIVACIDDLAALHCTPATLTLIRLHAEPQLLTVDPAGFIPWGAESASVWDMRPTHATRVLQLDVGQDAARCRIGPLTAIVGTSDRLAIGSCADDPVDGPWSSGTITAGGVRIGDQRYPTWTIAPWRSVWDWTIWARRYAPIITTEPAPHGLISDPWCFGTDLARIFARLPSGRCWKLVVIDGQHWIVPYAMETDPPIGYVFTEFPTDHPQLRVQL